MPESAVRIPGSSSTMSTVPWRRGFGRGESEDGLGAAAADIGETLPGSVAGRDRPGDFTGNPITRAAERGCTLDTIAVEIDDGERGGETSEDHIIFDE
jgi:hypothetical protein